MQSALIELKDVTLVRTTTTILTQINLSIYQGEQWAFVGKSGSGKTTLAQCIAGLVFCQGSITYNQETTVSFVEQQHRFRTRSNTNDFYYQQRFQSQDADDSLTIRQELESYYNEYPHGVDKLVERFGLKQQVDEPLIQLSNGENKRIQLIKALVNKPQILILDNPFTGLDTNGRAILTGIFTSIISEGLQLIMVAPRNHLPDFITHVAELDNGRVNYAGTKHDYNSSIHASNTLTIVEDIAALTTRLEGDFSTAVRMVNVNIGYGDRTILSNINWEIKKGECWSLKGPNGSGKSTLLSLITGDNPQAYANEIYIFDKRRGRGESIWDIKKNIGLVSPELHLYFPFGTSSFNAVASGLFDTIGLFRMLNESQEALVAAWLRILKIDLLGNKMLHQLSLGQQRMVLLARALVKNPALLVLDEPCQGLDPDQVAQFNSIIDELCLHLGTTLIYVSHYDDELPACISHQMVLA
ncbi:MAG: ATP-binding cassette domain-containing protein [Chitinophagaceae bacterium]|nr:ATP-binding cassette domain-containing protein [Chitinophagaceae bacterium]